MPDTRSLFDAKDPGKNSFLGRVEEKVSKISTGAGVRVFMIAFIAKGNEFQKKGDTMASGFLLRTLVMNAHRIRLYYGSRIPRGTVGRAILSHALKRLLTFSNRYPLVPELSTLVNSK